MSASTSQPVRNVPASGGWELARIGHGFRLAIDAAAAYFGATAPNPAVGCTLLDDEGEVLVTAAHHRAGAPHAEALAMAMAREKGVLARARHALVTLEPCNHTGRTPPCSDALRHSPVEDIWVGVADPNPVAGGGIAHMEAMPGGKRVTLLRDVPALQSRYRDCVALLAPFASRITRGRAWITVKQALDVNGSMIPPEGRTTFTDNESLILAHRLRRATDAVVTGIGTILADWPRLNVRHVEDHSERAPRLLVVCDRHDRLPAGYRDTMTANGFRVMTSPDVANVPEMLADHGVNWALVEAGPVLLAEIERLALWDDWLTIRRQAEGADRRSVRARNLSPLRFLPGTGLDGAHDNPSHFEASL